MAHAPFTLPTDLPRELPDMADAPRRREAAAAEPCYRSEAFAEDLDGAESAPPSLAGRQGWLSAAPLGVALAGALLAVFGGRG